MQSMITPLVTGAIELVTKSFNKNLEDIPGKKSKYLPQKTAILLISPLTHSLPAI